MNKQTLEGTTGWKNLWQANEVQVLMLTSLLFQVLLTFFAPLRKRSKSGPFNICIWSFYLSADAVALYTIGLISKSKFPGDSHAQGPVAANADLLAFWAPFLLLHLGGPDTITALALQDNELWLRHALQLTTQVALTLYVFFRSISRKNNHLWLPTLLMFVDGCVKYIERTCALYHASVESVRNSVSRKPEESTPNYSKLMEEYYSTRIAHIPTAIQVNDEDVGGETSTEERDPSVGNSVPDQKGFEVEETDEMVLAAEKYYMKVKGLQADVYLSLKDRKESRKFFLQVQAAEAIRTIEIELNLFYDVLFTKAFLLQRKRAYVRLVCFLSVLASLILFALTCKSSNYQDLDVVVTFILLGGAIAMDICSAVMLILSDWWIIIGLGDGTSKFLKPPMKWLLKCSQCAKPAHRTRWSESISKYNLLRRSFRDPPSFFKFIVIERIKDVLIGLLYVESTPVDKELLLKFIAQELQKKANLATDYEEAKEVCSARGNLVFQDEYFLASEFLSSWTVDVDFDASLLTWHLATDLCYWSLDETDHNLKADNQMDYRQFSKELSDYMSFLLLRQQELLSPVMGMSRLRFLETCIEAKKYMAGTLDPWLTCIGLKIKKSMYEVLMRRTSPHDEIQRRSEQDLFKKFSKNVQEEANFRRNIGVAKGDLANSVLFDACYLAQRLNMFGEKQWEITSKVWVELLAYAATQCSPRSHIAQLSKGGELITVVWLLMAHLGLGDHFMQSQGFRWTRLNIPK